MEGPVSTNQKSKKKLTFGIWSIGQRQEWAAPWYVFSGEQYPDSSSSMVEDLVHAHQAQLLLHCLLQELFSSFTNILYTFTANYNWTLHHYFSRLNLVIRFNCFHVSFFFSNLRSLSLFIRRMLHYISNFFRDSGIIIFLNKIYFTFSKSFSILWLKIEASISNWNER